MDLKEKINLLVKTNDIDYIGIAPVDRFKNAPRGHRPNDILPEAVSVISLGVKINLGPQVTQRLALNNRKLRHVSFSYRWFGYGLLNMYYLDRAAAMVTRVLEKNGEIAVPIVTSGVEDSRLSIAAFSNRHAAVAAGLGEIGWNGLCLTPEAGPRARFVSVITTAKLPPDPMYSGSQLCDVLKCKELGEGLPICIKLCPLHTFSLKRTVRIAIGDREFQYAYMDHMTCGKTAGLGLHPKTLGPKEMVIPKKVNYEESLKLKDMLPPQYQLEAIAFGRGHACGICMLRCPIAGSSIVDEILELKGEI